MFGFLEMLHNGAFVSVQYLRYFKLTWLNLNLPPICTFACLHGLATHAAACLHTRLLGPAVSASTLPAILISLILLWAPE